VSEEQAVKLQRAIELISEACGLDKETVGVYVKPLTAQDKKVLYLLKKIASSLRSVKVEVGLKDGMIVHAEPLHGLSVDQQLALYEPSIIRRSDTK